MSDTAFFSATASAFLSSFEKKDIYTQNILINIELNKNDDEYKIKDIKYINENSKSISNDYMIIPLDKFKKDFIKWLYIRIKINDNFNAFYSNIMKNYILDNNKGNSYVFASVNDYYISILPVKVFLKFDEIEEEEIYNKTYLIDKKIYYIDNNLPKLIINNIISKHISYDIETNHIKNLIDDIVPNVYFFYVAGNAFTPDLKNFDRYYINQNIDEETNINNFYIQSVINDIRTLFYFYSEFRVDKECIYNFIYYKILLYNHLFYFKFRINKILENTTDILIENNFLDDQFYFLEQLDRLYRCITRRMDFIDYVNYKLIDIHYSFYGCNEHENIFKEPIINNKIIEQIMSYKSLKNNLKIILDKYVIHTNNNNIYHEFPRSGYKNVINLFQRFFMIYVNKVF